MTVAGANETISTADLTVGRPNEANLYDKDGSLMLKEGVLVTGLMVSKLIRNGIDLLYYSPDGANAPSEKAPEKPSGQDDFQASMQMALEAYSPEKVSRLNAWLDRSTEIVENIILQCMETGEIDFGRADPIVQETTEEIRDSADPVVARTLVREADLDLARRCMQFSTLSIAVGLQMRLAPREVKELGRVALVHDSMLFQLPAHQRFPHQSKDDEAKRIYTQHPIGAQQLLASNASESPTLATMAAQVHERMDGSGFPKGLKADAIHPLSRILCVVDTYLTLTSPPAGHPRIVPADAVAYLVSGMSDGKFAPTAVCGLLETISLYPLGSLFELNDASQVRSIHTNGSDYGYPVVQDTENKTRRIDLKGSDLFVTRPIMIDAFGEARLPQS